jgi:hypothetical protein
MKKFRLLRADEIEARIQSVKSNGCVVLLYKDARCDMNILDETIGAENWQRNHEVINGNLFCNVGINIKKEDGFDYWVWKQDVGTESNTEKEKGQASDSFKRACFNWGIGRELYSSPFIWIKLDANEITNGKCYTKFIVKEIGYNEKEEINKLVIIDESGKERFRFPKSESKETPQPIQETDYRTLLINHCKNNGLDLNAISKEYNLQRGASNEDFKKVYELVCKM